MSMRTVKSGFSMVELLVVIAISTILSLTVYSFFGSSIRQYLNLSSDTQRFTDASVQSQRIARTLRGLSDILSVSADEITVYAYFSPADTYVSQIRYYKSVDGKSLLADVTQMTANPPTGSLIPSTNKTYTIIQEYATIAGVNLFTYLDSVGNPITLPISDLHTIKGIKVTLATNTDSAHKEPVIIYTSVSLRNRKTNL